jgi:hypothetical protein
MLWPCLSVERTVFRRPAPVLHGSADHAPQFLPEVLHEDVEFRFLTHVHAFADAVDGVHADFADLPIQIVHALQRMGKTFFISVNLHKLPQFHESDSTLFAQLLQFIAQLLHAARKNDRLPFVQFQPLG